MTVKPTYEELDERVRTLEREALEREKELKRAQEVYRSLLNSSPDAVVIYDLEGRTRYASPAFTDLFGWTLQEIEGERIPFVPESEKESTAAAIRDLLVSGKPCRNFETRRTTKDGRVLDVSIAASRYLDEEGTPAGILTMLRDISEKKRMESQLLHSHKMEAVGTLAGGISHDFNNILQIVSGYVQILLLSANPSHPDYAKLQAMERAARKGSELTKRLLIFSRKVEAELRPVDLNHAVLQVAKLLERTIPKMIRIHTELAQDLKVVNADPLQLEQIIINLGVNAADAMNEGGEITFKTGNVVLDEPYCRTHVGSKAGEHVKLSVSDTGRGIRPELQKHIFEPFFTTKGIGKGTGLGLAMVYGIVKNHGGYIDFESAFGRGTTFEIFFPVLAVDAGTGAADYRPDSGDLCGSGEKILVVDDEKLLLEMVGDLLGRFGYVPILAESGERAIEILRVERGRVELAILDLSMPGMGGYRCLKEMLGMSPGLKVIIASGYSDDQKVRETLRSGAAAFIAKPYHYNDMLKKIRDSLRSAVSERVPGRPAGGMTSGAV
jgi:PAS domain S-box-containing protein